MMLWVERGHAPDAIIARQGPEDRMSSFGLPGPPPRSVGESGAPPEAKTCPAGPMPGAEQQEKLQASPVRSRPVYPYPSIAAYDGKGDPNDASSYSRGDPLAAVQIPDWAGSELSDPMHLGDSEVAYEAGRV
jgi:hypothetical protein